MPTLCPRRAHAVPTLCPRRAHAVPMPCDDSAYGPLVARRRLCLPRRAAAPVASSISLPPVLTQRPSGGPPV
eukprot:6536314-Prymnesium_polylepis.1